MAQALEPLFWPAVEQPGNQALRHARLSGWRLQHTGEAIKLRPRDAKARLEDPKRRLGERRPRLANP